MESQITIDAVIIYGKLYKSQNMGLPFAEIILICVA